MSSGNIQSDGNITAAGKGQSCIPSKDKNAQFRKLKNLKENLLCFDCPNTRPTWASVTYGTFVSLYFYLNVYINSTVRNKGLFYVCTNDSHSRALSAFSLSLVLKNVYLFVVLCSFLSLSICKYIYIYK